MNEKLFEESFINETKDKYKDQSRFNWSPVAAFLIDEKYKVEKEKIKLIYSNYPSGKKKNDLKKHLCSYDSDEFWGAWAELKVFEILNFSGFNINTKPKIGNKTPDLIVDYPIDKENNRKVVIEVTTISCDPTIEKKKKTKIQSLLNEMNKIVKQTPYLLYVFIPEDWYEKLRLSMDHSVHSVVISELKEKIINNKYQKGEKFQISTKDISMEFFINSTTEKEGAISNWSIVGFYSDKDVEKFKERVLDRINEKILRYKNLQEIGIPFILAVFTKGPLPFGFHELFDKVINSKEIENMVNPIRALSGIVVYKSLLFTNLSKYYEIKIEPYLYIYPNASNPIDNTFSRLISMDLSESPNYITKLIKEGKMNLEN